MRYWRSGSQLARSPQDDPEAELQVFNHTAREWRPDDHREELAIVFTGDWTPVLEVEVEEVILSVQTGVWPTWRDPVEGWSTHRPLSLPPGPERRERMHAIGMNTSANDYTDAEWKALEAEVEKFAAARDENARPIADLFRVTS